MYSLIRILALIFTLFSSLDVWAWNAKVTHQDLSEKAAEYSVLSLAKGDYLKNLGFNNNLDEIFTLNGEPEKIRYWIRYGSLEEDAGSVFTAYYYHHFHNPLALSWDQAGLNTIYPWINGESSLIWAQDDKQDITPLNPWRWQKAREYYHIALTGKDLTGLEVAPIKEKRDEYFAQTFKGLGHIIHLIQDAAQPAHVRNDPHPLDDYGIVPQFENWTKDPDNQIAVTSFMSNPVFPSVLLNTSVSGYIPITQFWDINQYDGSNPPSGTAIGLSEYTNANFFSEDTINNSNFPNPKILDTTTTIVERNFTNTFWNTTYPRQYYLKNCCGEIKIGGSIG